ncbi:MAG TPA: filamentous hemagglutinin N-terminal domain-containing protein, partial [Rhodanobacter sp.]|nr:filamentous hemagglutinin N-terminal domain-containing protein [Rhodanobacter sp.]
MAKSRRKESVKLLGVVRRKRAALLMSTALQATVVLVLSVPGMPSPAVAQPAPNALPTAGAVVAGAAALSKTANQLTINQSSDRAALTFQTYNVGSQARVLYNQPSSNSVTLNRVTDANPSQIAGHIDANGKIVLMNQAGVTFYQGAQVNTNGLMVTAASMSDGAMKGFVNTGALTFDQAANPNARVENRGNITIKQAGLAALVAPQVANSGTITAKLGHVVLAGASKTTLDLYGDGLVSIDV